MIENASGLLEEQGISLLEPSAATDTNAFFVTQEYAEAEDLSALSDLEGMSVVLAAASDCEDRADCEGGLTEVYGIDMSKVLPLGFATDQTYQSVLSGESHFGLTSATDGTLESQGLVLLEDDRSAQNLVPAVGSAFLEENPVVARAAERPDGGPDHREADRAQRPVAVDRAKPQDVARDFLEEEGLL